MPSCLEYREELELVTDMPSDKEYFSFKSTVETGLAEIRSDLRWHLAIGGTIASLFLAALVGLLTWYLPKELASQKMAITNELRLSIGQVLAPAIQRLVLPEDKLKGASVADLQARFQKTSLTIDSALSADIPVERASLVPLESFIRTALQTRELPKTVRAEGLSAFIHIAGYSTFSKNWMEGAPYSIINVTIGKFGTAIVIEESARNRVVVYNSRLFEIGAQNIAWAKWIKTSFEDMKITYYGGDVYLADVTFKNCTFDFDTDKQSLDLLAKLQESQRRNIPTTALLAKGESLNAFDLNSN
jgi:hypothetical protein